MSVTSLDENTAVCISRQCSIFCRLYYPHLL